MCVDPTTGALSCASRGQRPRHSLARAPATSRTATPQSGAICAALLRAPCAQRARTLRRPRDSRGWTLAACTPHAAATTHHEGLRAWNPSVVQAQPQKCTSRQQQRTVHSISDYHVHMQNSLCQRSFDARSAARFLLLVQHRHGAAAVLRAVRRNAAQHELQEAAVYVAAHHNLQGEQGSRPRQAAGTPECAAPAPPPICHPPAAPAHAHSPTRRGRLQVVSLAADGLPYPRHTLICGLNNDVDSIGHPRRLHRK